MKRGQIKKFLLNATVALISLRVYLSALFGYFSAKFLAERWNSVVFNIGSYKLHFHHWLMGVFGLAAMFFYTFSPLINQILFGFLSGLVFEGVSNYPDWKKVLFKKEN